MIVRKRRLDTIADFDAAPEGEWFHAPDGLGIKIVFDDITLDADRLRIRLPQRVVRKFKAKRGRPLKAHISGDQLIVER
jgi:hypothetical protein